MPCTQKALGVPRLFHATTKYNITKVRTTMNGIKASVLKFVNSFFFLLHFSHMHTTITMQFCFIIFFSFFFLFLFLKHSTIVSKKIDEKIDFSDFFFFVRLNISPFFPLSLLFYGRDEWNYCARVSVCSSNVYMTVRVLWGKLMNETTTRLSWNDRSMARPAKKRKRGGRNLRVRGNWWSVTQREVKRTKQFLDLLDRHDM